MTLLDNSMQDEVTIVRGDREFQVKMYVQGRNVFAPLGTDVKKGDVFRWKDFSEDHVISKVETCRAPGGGLEYTKLAVVPQSEWEEKRVVREVTQQFYGGHFEGCSFGDNNSVTNYFRVVDNLESVQGDAKAKLKEAREAIQKESLSDEEKADIVEQLNTITAELGRSDCSVGRLRRAWKFIADASPTVAMILKSVESVAKLLTSPETGT